AVPVLVESFPYEGYIDSRGESGGVDRIVFKFSEPIFEPDGSELGIDSFSMILSDNPLISGAPREIEISDVNVNGEEVSLMFDDIIPAGEWIVIKFNAANSIGVSNKISFRLGSLPGDIDQNGKVDSDDFSLFSAKWAGGDDTEFIDLDRDGQIDIGDATEFSYLWFGNGGRRAWREISLPSLEISEEALSGEGDSCSDNDGGVNPELGGRISGAEDGEKYIYSDYCSGVKLGEYFCDGDKLVFVDIACTGEYVGCSYGACILAENVMCGDARCDESETVGSCPEDCEQIISGATREDSGMDDSQTQIIEIICGDNVCSDGETIGSCPSDCFSNSGSQIVCGNLVCEIGETISNCFQDCKSGSADSDSDGDVDYTDYVNYNGD
ncbi:MAG: hypothetical protein AABX73_00210, partial [Nanoarchaeota archaeon]